MIDATDDTPVRRLEDLELVFQRAQKPPSAWLIGAEAEKICVHADTAAPLPYSGERSVLSLFERLEHRYGWRPVRESENGPVVALSRGQSSVTLEPGAQVELSAAPLPDLHAVAAEVQNHLSELASISGELNLRWWSVGFHPLAKLEQMPWVPKERYPIMRSYLPTRGRRGLDMMQRTCTVQANFDYESEDDAIRRLMLMLRLSPVVQAMSANAPFFEGRVSRLKSERADVWLNMDPERSGIIARLWHSERPRYRDYVEWALDAGMFFFKRGSRVFLNTGQSFRRFWQDGFEGEKPTLGDWVWHLGTLFPEVRLKSTLEVRTSDAQSEALSLAMIAFFTGLVYDDDALEQAEQLARGFSYEAVLRARPLIPERGLETKVGALSLRAAAEKLVEIAEGGLRRRRRVDAAGRDESVFLEPLAKLVLSGRSPADALLQGLKVGDPVGPDALDRLELETTRAHRLTRP